MSQQQLLLLILGIIIVGLSMVFALNAFGINRSKANVDALMVEALDVATRVQAWSIKPALYGGRASNETIADVTLGALGFLESGGVYVSLNGTFELSTTLAPECDEPVIPSGQPALIYVNATNEVTGSAVCVAVAGPDDDDIGTDENFGSGVGVGS